MFPQTKNGGGRSLLQAFFAMVIGMHDNIDMGLRFLPPPPPPPHTHTKF